ncbi:hypothetical protein AYI69_g11168 [Smittium culicis]|uniref:Uncharacterized protein n=1 Tax=Smittium culicis TaxID=133412 RepID=A0A1R1X0M6_9FUNG|nr:hypothetical protein AYI69_g11168 [Smittium culicis]
MVSSSSFMENCLVSSANFTCIFLLTVLPCLAIFSSSKLVSGSGLNLALFEPLKILDPVFETSDVLLFSAAKTSTGSKLSSPPPSDSA